MHTRRTMLGTLGVTGTVAVSGCLSILQVDADAEAAPAAVSEGTTAGIGYEYIGTEPNEHHEEVDVFPFTAEFESTWWHSTYSRTDRDDSSDGEDRNENGDDRDVADREIARVDVISTPSERVRDREVNPVAHLEHEGLLEVFLTEVGESDFGDAFSAVLGDATLDDVTHVEYTERECLGDVIEISVFDATITLVYGDDDEGDATDVQLYVADLIHDGDIIVFVGFHLRDADEAENLYTLVEDLEHPVDL